MDILELMKARHSVRRYAQTKIPQNVREQLDGYVKSINAESGLNVQVIYDEPNCFDSFMAHYGKFENATNYIALIGKKSDDLAEKCGYFGEKIVLKAQELGLNTCWVALSHGKTTAKIADDEKEIIVISLGYGQTQGHPHKSKSPADVGVASDDHPEWFKRGVEAALLAPTAINQQKFRISVKDNVVDIVAGKIGPCLKIDLGIVKCHFELAAGAENFKWKS